VWTEYSLNILDILHTSIICQTSHFLLDSVHSRILEIAIFLNEKFQGHVFSTSNLILGAGYGRKILKKSHMLF